MNPPIKADEGVAELPAILKLGETLLQVIASDLPRHGGLQLALSHSALRDAGESVA